MLDSRVKADALLIAADFQHGCLTASVDCGWKQTSYCTFRNGDELVKVISRQEHLRGLPRGTKLYLGYGFYQREDARLIYDLAKAHEFVVVNAMELAAEKQAMQ